MVASKEKKEKIHTYKNITITFDIAGTAADILLNGHTELYSSACSTIVSDRQ